MPPRKTRLALRKEDPEYGIGIARGHITWLMFNSPYIKFEPEEYPRISVWIRREIYCARGVRVCRPHTYL